MNVYPMTKTKALWIAALALAGSFLLGTLLGGTAHAQEVECLGETGGGVEAQHSAVKRPGDPVLLTWTAPTCDASGDRLEGPTALTGFEVFVSIDLPVSAELGPVVTVGATQNALELTADASKGQRIYYSIRAVNDFGQSNLSTQNWIKLPGNPNAARSAAD